MSQVIPSRKTQCVRVLPNGVSYWIIKQERCYFTDRGTWKLVMSHASWGARERTRRKCTNTCTARG